MPSEHTSANGVTTTWSVNENDYQFVLAVMGEMIAKYGEYIDQKRIYAFGHSQGGSLTNYLSERDPNLFTAYAVNAGGGRNFAAGTPPAPMYGIYGEYDSVSYLSGRTGWFTRNNLNLADGVITDPFDLPDRYGNPIQYLIYPDTPAYPGDQYVTTSWYDANGIPMFNETIAYGKEHNNTVSGMRRTWTDWFSKWGRDAEGNRVYGYLFAGVGQPLESGKTFNAGSAIPVKFALQDFNDNYDGSALAQLYYAPVTAGTAGTYQPAISKGNANKDNTFKYSAEDNQYVFNMDTKGLAAGVYRLKIVVDGTQIIKTIDVTITKKW
jgi:hypothetical protein